MRRNTTHLKMQLAIGAASMALVLFAWLLTVLSDAPDAAAAPLPAPTPVSVNRAGGNAAVLSFWRSKVITGDVASACLNVQNHDKIDLQWVIDQGTAVNTTTLTLRYSNNGGADTVDGATVLNASDADAADMQQYMLFGGCAQIAADVVNANPVTVTVIGVAK